MTERTVAKPRLRRLLEKAELLEEMIPDITVLVSESTDHVFVERGIDIFDISLPKTFPLSPPTLFKYTRAAEGNLKVGSEDVRLLNTKGSPAMDLRSVIAPVL